MAIYKTNRFPFARRLPDINVASLNEEPEFIPEVKEEEEKKSPKKGSKETEQELESEL